MLLLVGIVAVLALCIAFLLGRSTGDSDVTVNNCEPTKVAGWEFDGC
jgi:hypothetical protein